MPPPLRGGGIIKTVKEDELNDATDQWTGDVDYQRRRQRRTFCSSPTARPVNFSREFCRYFKRFYEEKLHHSCEKALFPTLISIFCICHALVNKVVCVILHGIGLTKAW